MNKPIAYAGFPLPMIRVADFVQFNICEPDEWYQVTEVSPINKRTGGQSILYQDAEQNELRCVETKRYVRYIRRSNRGTGNIMVESNNPKMNPPGGVEKELEYETAK